MTRTLTLLICGIGLLADKQKLLAACLLVVALAGCVKEPPPRSVTEFLENSILLEAAMVQCSQDRSGTRYDAECVNAREAVKRIAAVEEAERKDELEARSESMRRARRRAQEASAEVRRRAREAERQRHEAEYLAQFGVPPPPEDGSIGGGVDSDNTPVAVVSEVEPESELPDGRSELPPATEAGIEPAETPQTDSDAESGDLNAIREELRQRSEDGEN